ncbi:MAG: holo-ACP synthase [Bacteriovoracia bacterium]
MSIKGHGIDLVSIDRIRKILEKEGSHFETRVFSAAEIAYCRSKKDPYPYFAARFAAKEAYGKALKLGLGPSGDFAEIEVAHEEGGAPIIKLSGRAAEIFHDFDATKIFLSLSHEGDMAMASVILG